MKKLIYIIPILLLWSCGAVKKDSSRSTEVSEVDRSVETLAVRKDTTNVKKTEKITVDDKTKTTTRQTIYEPVDPSKPATATNPDGSKELLLNARKTVTETSVSNDVKTGKDSELDKASKSELSTLTKEDYKAEEVKEGESTKVDRDQWSACGTYVGLAALIGTVIALYLAAKKYIP